MMFQGDFFILPVTVRVSSKGPGKKILEESSKLESGSNPPSVHSICQCAPTCIQCLDEVLHVYIDILYMCVCTLYCSILSLLSFCKRAMTKTSGGNFV